MGGEEGDALRRFRSFGGDSERESRQFGVRNGRIDGKPMGDFFSFQVGEIALIQGAPAHPGDQDERLRDLRKKDLEERIEIVSFDEDRIAFFDKGRIEDDGILIEDNIAKIPISSRRDEGGC